MRKFLRYIKADPEKRRRKAAADTDKDAAPVQPPPQVLTKDSKYKQQQQQQQQRRQQEQQTSRDDRQVEVRARQQHQQQPPVQQRQYPAAVTQRQTELPAPRPETQRLDTLGDSPSPTPEKALDSAKEASNTTVAAPGTPATATPAPAPASDASAAAQQKPQRQGPVIPPQPKQVRIPVPLKQVQQRLDEKAAEIDEGAVKPVPAVIVDEEKAAQAHLDEKASASAETEAANLVVPEKHADIKASKVSEGIIVSTMAPVLKDIPMWQHSRIFPVRQQDLLKFRKHRGLNLGSWFVLERWIAESPYREAAAPAQSDLDVAKGTNAKAILEKHWDTWITASDWDWIASVGINSVRIPIGYYHACGADRTILDGTDFWPFYDVYAGAWKRVTNAIAEAAKRNITVQIDLHAAPGKQNNDAHSGTSNKANFFNDPHNLERGVYALQSISTALASFLASNDLSNLVGIELVNEPSPPSDDALKGFYKNAIAAVQAKIDAPVYMGEFWRPEVYANFIANELGGVVPGVNPEGQMVLDHHLYRCFTPQDNATPVQEHTRALALGGPTAQVFERVSETVGRAGGGLAISEWSGGLSPGSLVGLSGSSEVAARRAFVDAQLRLYEATCAGWYFWTYKREVKGDDGWSFREMVVRGIVPGKFGMWRVRWPEESGAECVRRSGALAKARREAYDAHASYWEKIPGNYEPQRFANGFEQGWNANYRFFDSLDGLPGPVSEIGFKHALAGRSSLSRTGNYWEYEHGFLQGCDAARADFVAAFC